MQKTEHLTKEILKQRIVYSNWKKKKKLEKEVKVEQKFLKKELTLLIQTKDLHFMNQNHTYTYTTVYNEDKNS